jgi:hypothetical protein
MKCNAKLVTLALGIILVVPSVSSAQDAWPSRTITFVSVAFQVVRF